MVNTIKHWPWQHQFEAVEVEHVIADYFRSGEMLKHGIGTRETIVLKRCPCGKVKTTRLLGFWCLAQVTGRANVSRQGQLGANREHR